MGENLVCGSCANPVAEGRCPVCRNMRSQLDRGLSPFMVALGALLLVLAVAMLLGRPF